jgi:hypothetical protein
MTAASVDQALAADFYGHSLAVVRGRAVSRRRTFRLP